MLYQLLMKLKLWDSSTAHGYSASSLGNFSFIATLLSMAIFTTCKGSSILSIVTDPPLSELDTLSWTFSLPLALGDSGGSLLTVLLSFLFFLWRLRLLFELVFADSFSSGTPSLACALVTTLKEAISSLPDVGGDGIMFTRCKLEVDGPAGYVAGFGLLGQFLLRCSIWHSAQNLSTLGQFMLGFMLGLLLGHSLAQ